MGRAELAQDVRDIFCDSVERDNQLRRDGLVRTARRQHRQHLLLAAGQRLDDSWRRSGGALPGVPPGALGVKRALEPGQAVKRDPLSDLADPLGGDERPISAASRPLVGEDPDIVLGAGQPQHLSQGIHRGDCSPLAASASARSAPASMTLPTRRWLTATAFSRFSSASA